MGEKGEYLAYRTDGHTLASTCNSKNWRTLEPTTISHVVPSVSFINFVFCAVWCRYLFDPHIYWQQMRLMTCSKLLRAIKRWKGNYIQDALQNGSDNGVRPFVIRMLNLMHLRGQIEPLDGEMNSSVFNVSLHKDQSQSWGSACGGPLLVAIVVPFRALQDINGQFNGASNTLWDFMSHTAELIFHIKTYRGICIISSRAKSCCDKHWNRALE